MAPIAAAALLAGCASPTRLSLSDQRALSGRVYVVTGASSGFGQGVAELLGRNRASVVLAARRTELLESVAQTVRAAGGQALVVTTDVSDPAAMERLAAAATERFGRIDVWINNAGVGVIGLFERIPAADHSRVIDVNVKGVIYGSQAALTRFRQQGAGVLVNIGSVESKIPIAYHASYSASKHAVLGLGEALAQELRLSRAKGIKVVTVMPWAADTLYWQNTANYSGRRPRMILMDPAEMVASAIVRASLHPRKRVSVGWKAAAANAADDLVPDLTAHIAANIVRDTQMRDAPPAPDTSGALHRPMPENGGVSGGNRERIKAEEAERDREMREDTPQR
jgi:short-subunit dehydrogenase